MHPPTDSLTPPCPVSFVPNQRAAEPLRRYLAVVTARLNPIDAGSNPCPAPGYLISSSPRPFPLTPLARSATRLLGFHQTPPLSRRTPTSDSGEYRTPLVFCLTLSSLPCLCASPDAFVLPAHDPGRRPRQPLQMAELPPNSGERFR